MADHRRKSLNLHLGRHKESAHYALADVLMKMHVSVIDNI